MGYTEAKVCMYVCMYVCMMVYGYVSVCVFVGGTLCCTRRPRYNKYSVTCDRDRDRDRDRDGDGDRDRDRDRDLDGDHDRDFEGIYV